MLRKIIRTWPVWMTLPIRLTLGAIFIAHGSQKVLGKFGGPGFNTFISYPAPFPFMRPAWLWMAAAAVGELLGGVLVLLGLLTRVGAFLIATTMIVAIFGVHWPVFFGGKGFEYPLALLSMCVALLISGGGYASFDKAMYRGR
jgi:putative oxidoreductase